MNFRLLLFVVCCAGRKRPLEGGDHTFRGVLSAVCVCVCVCVCVRARARVRPRDLDTPTLRRSGPKLRYWATVKQFIFLVLTAALSHEILFCDTSSQLYFFFMKT